MERFIEVTPFFLLIVASITLVITIYKSTKKPNIEIYCHTPKKDIISPSISLNFIGNYSSDLKLTISIYNIGSKNAFSINSKFVFNSEVVITDYPDSNNWKRLPDSNGFKIFLFRSDNNIWPKDSNKQIGSFKIRIPSKTKFIDYLIFNAFIDGDFEKKFCLLSYEYENSRLYLHHFSGKNLNKGNEFWNQRLLVT